MYLSGLNDCAIVNALARILGLRPISAVVDVTNYVMFDLNRPLHAYDSDKINKDIIIFKFPRDVRQKYVKRCVAEPGDILEIKDNVLYINQEPYLLPKSGKFLSPELSQTFFQQDIFLGNYGNKDHFKEIRIPKKGDAIKISPENAQLLLHIMLLDGHKLKLVKDSKTYFFTMTSPDELFRRKGKMNVYSPYFPDGELLVPWSINSLPNGILYINDTPISELEEYVVEKDYFWAMGDNRDDSLDSRYWGFVPENHIVGKALFIWMSWDKNAKGIKKIRWDRLFNSIK